ncbi:LysR family transcriptional regulator [Sphingomonas faeni]|uniref:LysR family transcriptional regulator n=1 Tax=Sphingomonas faeni TaxID=185950 RepID=UPI0020C81601|nr:LysR family transcriptional regulator [Sphingomonas faeni]MCP8892042.1 LysR family transcriptional regulator [Sphingomonas faeni]
MDLRQINYFIALFEEGSVTRAAQRLHVVQPAVSMQIARMERELGQKLFDRTPKSMVPTAAGRTLHRLVLPVVRNLSLAHEHMARLSGVVSGRVTMGMLASLATSLIPGMLTGFADDYPEIEVAVVDGYSSTFIDLVNEGQLDFAVINRPSRKLGLIVDPLVEEQMVLVTGAADDEGEDEGAVSIKRLTDYKLVLPTRRHGLRTELERHLANRNVTLEPRLELDAIEGIVELVAGSDWATILPSLAIRRHLARRRVHIRAIEPMMVRRLAVIHHPRHPLSPASHAFIDHLRQALVAMAGDGWITAPD